VTLNEPVIIPDLRGDFAAPGSIMRDATGEWIYLGHGVSYAPVLSKAGKLIGLLERHPCTAAPVGAIALLGAPGWPPAYNRWSLRCADPLTLYPALRCPHCGRHGWIRDGRWVPEKARDW
jgi:hypothetical protein